MDLSTYRSFLPDRVQCTSSNLENHRQQLSGREKQNNLMYPL